jgi:hypothetical protein
MYHLRQHNGQALSKARLYGIAKEKYVAQKEDEYNETFTTEFDSTVIKHPTLDEYALSMAHTGGLPEVFLVDVEEELPEGWIVEVQQGE